MPILSGPGHFVMVGQGPRSLGTIQPKQILEASYKQIESKWDYRLRFVDGNDKTYRLGVTDLSWRYYNDFQFNGGHSADEISATLTRKLRSNQVYLRVGLARGWKEYPDRCYLQLTGIYTFPDYLEGKTFADLSPDSFQ